MKLCLLYNNENPIGGGGVGTSFSTKFFFHTLPITLPRLHCNVPVERGVGGGLNLHPNVGYLNDVYFAKTWGGGVAKPPLAPTVLTPMNLINLIVSFKFPIVQTQRRTFHLYL